MVQRVSTSFLDTADVTSSTYCLQNKASTGVDANALSLMSSVTKLAKICIRCFKVAPNSFISPRELVARLETRMACSVSALPLTTEFQVKPDRTGL